MRRQQGQERQLPTIKLPPRAHNITGKRYGLLTVVRPVKLGQRGVMWECRCDCGRLAKRYKAALRRAERLGQESCCSECWQELSGGYLEAGRLLRLRRLRESWELYRSLYSPMALEAMTAKIRDELADELGVRPRRSLPPPKGQVHNAEWPEEYSPARQQRGAYLHPIEDAEGGGWRCVDCAKWFTAGQGCVLCCEPVCERCTGAEAHKCSTDADNMTWKEVADYFGVGTTRVHQMVMKALRKLRHPSRLRMLRDFHPNDDVVLPLPEPTEPRHLGRPSDWYRNIQPWEIRTTREVLEEIRRRTGLPALPEWW